MCIEVRHGWLLQQQCRHHAQRTRLLARTLYVSFTALLYKGASCNALLQLRSFDIVLLETSALVRSHINSLAPINRLPPEVLSVIFSMASLTLFSPGYPRRPEGQYQSSRVLHTQIMRVCRQWRGVAQSATFLWSDIVLRPQKGSSLSSQIKRARTTFIGVYSEGDVKPLIPVLSEHAHRIRRLHVRTMDNHWIAANPRIKAVFAALPKMALHIEELVLHPWSVDWRSPTASLFSGPAPRLRVLSLHELSFVPTDHFPNLQKLFITLQGAPEQSELLNMLQGSPMLEHVHIWTSRVVPRPGGAPHSRVARLPHLQALVLCLGHNTPCLLSDLVLPPSCLVRLQLEDAPLDEVPLCLAALERHMDARLLTKLSWSQGIGMGFLANRGVLYVTLCNAAADAGLQIGVSLRGYNHARAAFADVFRRAFDTCPLYAHVTELSVFAKRNLVDCTILGCLRSLTTVNHIFAPTPSPRLSHVGARTRRRRRDTTRVPSLARAGPDGALTCPALYTLYFIGCGAAELRDARAILQARKESGRPLTRLGIDCSARFREDVNALRELVDELDVAVTDEPGYEELKWGVGQPKGGWRSHSAQARYEWPKWAEFREFNDF